MAAQQSILSVLYHKNRFFRLVARPIKPIFEFFYYKIVPEKIFVLWNYYRRIGHFPDLKNPTRISEKLQWIKLYDRTSLHTLVADKVAVRDYVAQKVGKDYLVPDLGVYDDPDEIHYEKLPQAFVIKANHTSGDVLIVRNKLKYKKSEIVSITKPWLSKNYYSRTKEWGYKNIKPKLIIENFLESGTDKPIEDYKIHCFNGKVNFIEVMYERFSEMGIKEICYDRKWKKQDFVFSYPSFEGTPARQPAKLNEMIEIAEKLSMDFDYIRVDLYYVAGSIYFGELTLVPHSGYDMYLQPKEIDLILGRQLRLTKCKTA